MIPCNNQISKVLMSGTCLVLAESQELSLLPFLFFSCFFFINSNGGKKSKQIIHLNK